MNEESMDGTAKKRSARSIATGLMIALGKNPETAGAYLVKAIGGPTEGTAREHQLIELISVFLLIITELRKQPHVRTMIDRAILAMPEDGER